jgi:hypothetical protein
MLGLPCLVGAATIFMMRMKTQQIALFAAGKLEVS